MERYSDERLRSHALAWTRTWVPWCANHGISDPFAYDLRQGVECLCAVQDLTALDALTADKAEQHATFKAARAAMSAFWSIACPGTDFAEDAAVKAIAVGLRRAAPNLARYHDTWDVSLVFDRVFALAEAGTPIIALPHGKKRAWVALLLKLKTKCRTGDLAPNKSGRGGVFRTYAQQRKELFGLQGDHLAGTVKQLRFYQNKTTIARPSKFSKWHPLGDYLRATDEFPHLGDACPRAMLETYIDETDGLPRADDYLFVSAVKTAKGKHARVVASRLANLIVSVLRECGVPDRFKGHSTRHASLSAGAADPLTDLDAMLSSADLSAKVFRLYYSRNVAEDAEAERKLRHSSHALAAMLSGHQSQHKKWVRDGCIAAELDKARQRDNDKLARAASGKPPAATASTAGKPNAKAPAKSKRPPTAAAKRAAKRAKSADAEWEVESILDSRVDIDGCKVFAVKWAGFEDLTWEPRAHLVNAKTILRAFERSRSKLKMRPTSEPFRRFIPADPTTGKPEVNVMMVRKRALKGQPFFRKMAEPDRRALLRASLSDEDRVVPGPVVEEATGVVAPASTVEPPVVSNADTGTHTPTVVVESPVSSVAAPAEPSKQVRVARGSARAAASRPQDILGGLSLLQLLHGEPVQRCGSTPRVSRLVRAKPPPRAEDSRPWFGTGVPVPDLPCGRLGVSARVPTSLDPSSECATSDAVSPLTPVSMTNGSEG